MKNKKYEKAVMHYLSDSNDNQIFQLTNILSVIILSRYFFKHNQDLKQFTKNVLNIEYKEYLFKSRTLLFSRVIKDVYIYNDDIKKINLSILKFVRSYENVKKHHNEKKASQSEIIDKWRKVINPDD